jgi:hypothetical protein
MFRPPKLWSAHLDELIAGVGGRAAAAKLLDVHPRTIARWCEGDAIPKMALSLLWYSGPQAREAAAADMKFDLNTQHTLARAHEFEVRRLRELLAAYELNGAPARAVELHDMAVNDEHGALPPTPFDPARRHRKAG